ncbi:MAG: acyltransferase [Clostridia bacterium]|nr:acyltransferase [Clostridia bacterium]
MNDRTRLICNADGRCAAIDLLRGFSILTVVLMHLVQGFLSELPTLLYQAAALGGTGAHVFLFCSGFGLYASHLRHPLTPAQFWCRRFGKVYLPYLPIVLISAAIPALCGTANRLGAVAAHLLLYKMFVPQYMESLGLHLWFVSAIFQLYLLFPLLCTLRRRLGLRALIVMGIGVSTAWWCFTAVTGLYTERVWNSFCAQFLWEFVLGMAAAEYLHRGGRIRLSPLWLGVTAVLGLGLQAIIALWGGYPLRLFNDIPALFGYGALALLLGHLGRGWFDRAMYALSKIAYAWYLTHILVFTAVFSLLGTKIHVIPLAVAAFVLSLAVAWGYAKLPIDQIFALRRKHQ